MHLVRKGLQVVADGCSRVIHVNRTDAVGNVCEAIAHSRCELRLKVVEARVNVDGRDAEVEGVVAQLISDGELLALYDIAHLNADY